MAHLTSLGFPFAAFGRTRPDQPQSWVDVDSVQAVIDLVGLVAAKGHRRVAFLASTSGQPRMDDRPTAIMAGDDWLALGVYTAARARRREIGRDLAVVAFDDLPITAFVRVGA